MEFKFTSIIQAKMEGLKMQLDARLEKLADKHASLEKAIDEEVHRPVPDNLHLSELKRRKLRIKDEIFRIQGG